MATLISGATGNFTAAGTWYLCDATSENDSEAISVASTTSFVASSTFTPGVISINGLAIKPASRPAATGTFTIELYNVTLASSVTNTSTTVNVSDMNSAGNGWYVFPTNGTVVLVGATGYAIRIKSSVAGEVTLFASSGTNWTRQIRTTTTQAPAAGDKLIIAGEKTGAGTGNNFTVTMDNTATTSFGPTVSGGPPQGMTINSGGTLQFSTSIAAYFKVKGVLAVYGGGTLNIGTSGTPVASGSSAILEFDAVANVDSGLNIFPGAIFNAYGNAKWPTSAITAASNATPIQITSAAHGLVAGVRILVAGVGGNTAANGTVEVIASIDANNFTIGAINGGTGGLVGTSTGNGAYTSGGTWQRLAYTRLTADKAAAATVMAVLSTSGIVANDEMVFLPTGQTASQAEKKTVTSNDSATGFTLSAGLTNAHSGTSPTQCRVGNLTRNVKIRGVSASLCGYVLFQTTSVGVCSNVEFTQLGSATANKRGIDATTTTGSLSLTYCSLHDSTVVSSIGFNISGAASNNITFSQNVTYNVANFHFQVAAATTGTWACDGNLICRNTDSANLVNCLDVGGTFTNNHVAGAVTNGVVFNEALAVLGTFSGNTSHSNGAGNGIQLRGPLGGSTPNLSLWRNSMGLSISDSASNLTITNLIGFGNATCGANITNNSSNIFFTGGMLAGDTSFAQNTGMQFLGCTDIVVESMTFGTVTGIFVNNGTQDLRTTTANAYVTATLRACTFDSATLLGNPSNMTPGSYVRLQSPVSSGSTGFHITYVGSGTIRQDANYYDVGPSAIRLTPTSASVKLATDGASVDGKGAFRVAVPSGTTVTVSAKVRESVVGGEPDYTGNRAQLILRKNVAAGIAADIVLATATVASEGAFEIISGTTAAVTQDAVLSFVVVCDGTTGYVSADTWTAA